MPSYYSLSISRDPDYGQGPQRPAQDDRRERAAQLQERHLSAQARRELRIFEAAKAGAPIDPAKGDVRADD